MDVKTSTTDIVSNARHLTSAISADDLEIKWFKETDCMCSYQKGQMIKGINYKVDEPSEKLERENILPLKKEFGVGDYLCKITCEDRIKEINISLKEAPGTEKQTSTWKLNDKHLTDEDRMNKTCYALLDVLSAMEKLLQTDRQDVEAAKNLDKQKQGCPENIDYDKKDNNAPETKPEEKDSQQENTSTVDGLILVSKQTSPSQLDKDNIGSTQPECAENKEYEKTMDNNAPVQQTSMKGEHKESKPEEKDSQQESTNQGGITAMETSQSQSEDQHNNGNPQPDCSDQEQIQSQMESHMDIEESDELQMKKPKTEKKGGKVFSILAGKIDDIHKEFIVHLQDRIEDLTEAHSVEDSDVVLIFCPIVSRAGTDIDSALAKIDYASASKLTVLVVLHHTFDTEKTVSDSSKSVNKENLLTVDCLFYEDTGLLQCQRNSDAFDKSVNWLIQQGHTVDSSFQHKTHSSLSRMWSTSLSLLTNFMKQETSGDEKKVASCFSK